MRWFPAWPMLLLLVAITLLPLADAFKGQGMLRRAKTVVKGIPAALRIIVNDIDVRVILEESTAEPAPEVFWTATQPEKEPVLERVVRSRAAMAVEAPPQPIVPEAVHWSPVVFGDWPVVDETVVVTDGTPVCQEPGACAVATLSSVAPLDVAAFRVDHVPSCPWSPSLGFPQDLEPASVGTARHPTSPATMAPFDDGGALCVWPPFLGVAEIEQTSPMPLCDEPGACAVASLSLMKPLDLVQMVQRALLAETGRAALQQLIRVSQTQRMLRDWDLSMVCFAGRNSTQHFGFWSLMFLVQKAGWRSWNYSVPAAMPVRDWSMTALCGGLSCCWLVMTLCRRSRLFAGAVSNHEEERRRWQTEADIATAAAVAASGEKMEKKMQLVFQSQLEEERARWQTEAEIATAAAIAASEEKMKLVFHSQLEMGQAKLADEMATVQQEIQDIQEGLTGKLNDLKNNADALGAGLLNVQSKNLPDRQLTKVLHKMNERAEESARVWGKESELGSHFAHWKVGKNLPKAGGGGDDDEREEEAGGNLSGPSQQEGEQKEEAGGQPSGPPQEEEGGGKRRKTRRGKRGGKAKKEKKPVGEGEGDDSSDGMSGGGEGGQGFSAGT